MNLESIKKEIQKIDPRYLGAKSLKKIIKLKYINKSSTYHLYKFSIGKKSFVLKKRKDGKKIKILNTYLGTYNKLKSYGIKIPNLYYYSPDKKFAIFEWYEGEDLLKVLSKKKSKKFVLSVLDKCAHVLAELHSKSIVVPVKDLYKELLHLYRPVIIPGKELDKESLHLHHHFSSNKTLKKYLQIAKILFSQKKGNTTFSLIHGDAHLENFVKTERGIKLIDWCKFLYGDPAFDICRFLFSAKLKKEYKTYFLNKYKKYFIEFGGTNICNFEKRLQLYEQINKESFYLNRNRLPLNIARAIHKILYYIFRENNRRACYIQVTRKCNRKCIFCSNPFLNKELSLEEIKKQIDDYIKEGATEIIFSGGEPTLHKDLPKLISYCKHRGIACRIITNAQKLSNKKYAKILKKAGLNHVMISMCSYKEKIEEKLTGKKGSYRKTLKGIKNTLEYIGPPDINITLTSLNIDHLVGTVKFIVKNFPQIQHFVFNNLDPTGRVLNNLYLVPKLVDLEINLHKALAYLESKGKTFRVERVPLCYMNGFEEYSTETRKIVKRETYRCLFLNKNNLEDRNVKNFFSVKDEKCSFCFLNQICAGLNPKYAKLLGTQELYPVFKDKNQIVKKITI